jgi:hypothetical protein
MKFDVDNNMYVRDDGMTLRDYFAAQVLIGLSIQRKGLTDEHDARNAYSLADAMLKAREVQR